LTESLQSTNDQNIDTHNPTAASHIYDKVMSTMGVACNLSTQNPGPTESSSTPMDFPAQTDSADEVDIFTVKLTETLCKKSQKQQKNCYSENIGIPEIVTPLPSR